MSGQEQAQAQAQTQAQSSPISTNPYYTPTELVNKCNKIQIELKNQREIFEVKKLKDKKLGKSKRLSKN